MENNKLIIALYYSLTYDAFLVCFFVTYADYLHIF